MDLSKVVAELRMELQRLDAAIMSLERLKEEGRKRGRPPKLLVDLDPSVADGPESHKHSGDSGAHNR
jgi:hypothetical protein